MFISRNDKDLPHSLSASFERDRTKQTKQKCAQHFHRSTRIHMHLPYTTYTCTQSRARICLANVICATPTRCRSPIVCERLAVRATRSTRTRFSSRSAPHRTHSHAHTTRLVARHAALRCGSLVDKNTVCSTDWCLVPQCPSIWLLVRQHRNQNHQRPELRSQFERRAECACCSVLRSFEPNASVRNFVSL